MNYINKYDIRDKLLQISDEDIAEANAYVSDLANGLGVNIELIPKAVPVKVKRLAVVYACYVCCVNHIGTDSTTTFDNGERQDIFEQKMNTYKAEMEDIVATLTAKDFLGSQSGGKGIPLWRA